MDAVKRALSSLLPSRALERSENGRGRPRRENVTRRV
jgi:hypothetical protein